MTQLEMLDMNNNNMIKSIKRVSVCPLLHMEKSVLDRKIKR